MNSTTGTSSINFYSKLNKEAIKMACIYKCTRLSDDKVVYVGLTIYTLDFRLNGAPYGHFLLAFEKNSQTYFHRALRKYGKDAFKFEVIEERESSEFSSREDMNTWLNEREKYWIAYYDTFNTGYNQTTGGHDFYHRSAENKRVTSETTKRAMSKLNTKELCNPYKHMTEEERIEHNKYISKRTKEAMAKYNTKELCNPTKHMTKEEARAYRSRIAKALLGKPVWNSGKIGAFSEESRQKMSQAHTGRIWITNGTIDKHVYQHELQTYSQQGFVKGRTYRNTELSESTLAKISVISKGKKWMTNGTTNVRVYPEDIQKYINMGYTLGKTNRRNK